MYWVSPKMVDVTSWGSDQIALKCNLIRAFAYHQCYFIWNRIMCLSIFLVNYPTVVKVSQQISLVLLQANINTTLKSVNSCSFIYVNIWVNTFRVPSMIQYSTLYKYPSKYNAIKSIIVCMFTNFIHRHEHNKYK